MGVKQKMTYEYNIYYRQNCIIPIILILFIGLLMVKIGWNLFKKFSTINFYQCVKENIPQCIFLIGCLFLIAINSIHLFRGGIYLLTEKESDVININGTIEETIEIDFLTGSKYNVENNHGRGEAIVINGTRYYLTTYGDLKVGDNVSITVLPKSKFILEIQKTDSKTA